MNNRNLALKISKHPLIEILKKDKTIPKSVVARLIVEELMDEAAKPKTKSAKSNLNTTLKKINISKLSNEQKINAIQIFIKNLQDNPGYYYNKYDQLEEDQKKIYNTYVSKLAIPNAEKILNALKQLQNTENNPPEQIQQAEDKIEVALEKEAEKEAEVISNIENFSNALARQELDIKPIEEKFGQYEYFKNLNAEEKKVMFKFIALLKRKNLFEGLSDKTSLVLTLKNLGVKKPSDMEVILQYMTEEEQQIVQNVLANEQTSYEKFLNMLEKAEVIPAPKTQRKEPEQKTQMPTSEETVQTSEDPKDYQPFVKASNILINDFYRQKYKIQQAKIVDAVIQSMKEFVDDEDMEKAFQRIPDTTTSETGTIQEQEEKVEATEDQMRNIRIDVKSFLARVNKTKEYLNQFEKVAKRGSVLGDAYKKRFVDNLKEIQIAVYRIAIILNKILGPKQELSEAQGSETMKKWQEVQGKYDQAVKAVNSLKELVATQTPPTEIDQQLINDAYDSLVDLSQHFPSVSPFGKPQKGVEMDKVFDKYQTEFGAAIQAVKDSLQTSLNVMKLGEAGRESLQNARDGLRDFADEINTIFGVPSRFADAKVKPEDAKAEATKGEAGVKDKEPEEEKYSDEISEEDKELIKTTLDQDQEYYKKAVKRLKELNLNRAEDFGFVPDVPLSEVMKKTEQLIKDLESAKVPIKLYEKTLEKAGDSLGNKGKEAKQRLIKALQNYIKLYEKMQDAIRYQDFSSILDSPEKRVEKVSKLIDVAKRYLDEKSAINNLFVAIINDAFGDEKDLEMIWKALKDADGKEAERLTGDVKYKIKRAGQNIKNIFKGTLDPNKLDFSSFKQFIGMVADKISKTSINLKDKINEEEEQDVELEPNQQEEQSDEELKIYQDNFSNALKHMNSFVSLFASFDHAIEQIEKDVGRTKFLEVFDKEFSSVKGLLAIMDNHLKKVSDMFGKTITVREAELYGFPPDDFILPEPEEEILDIPEPDQEKIVDIVKANIGKMDNSQEFWNKPLENQVDLVLKMPELEKYKVKYFDAKPIDKNKKDYENLIDKIGSEDKKETPDEIGFSTFKKEYGTEFTEKENKQNIPEMLKFVLEQFHKYTGAIRESIEDIKSKLSEFEKKCLSDSLDDLESKYENKGLQSFLGFLGKTSTDRIPGGESTPDDPKPINQRSYRKQSKAGHAFLKTLQKISKARKQTEKLKESKKEKFYKFMAIPLKSDLEPTEKIKENILANKLKPLIREMINKGNKK
jgi:hypothetical protein